MADNARKYAREIAGLKLRLAEKEAELMGGFGAPINLALDELPEPAPREVRAVPRAALRPSQSRTHRTSAHWGNGPNQATSAPRAQAARWLIRQPSAPLENGAPR